MGPPSGSSASGAGAARGEPARRHQPARHRLRGPADGLLQRDEGRGRRSRRPVRHQHRGHQGPGPEGGGLRRGDHRRGRQDRRRVRIRRHARSQPAAHGLPAADGADVVAPVRSPVLRGRRDRQLHDPLGRGARDHRLGRRRRSDVLARGRVRGRGLQVRRARRPVPGARQQLRQHRGAEDGARRVRRVHGGVRAPPDGLRVRSRTASSTWAPSATRTAATARRC